MTKAQNPGQLGDELAVPRVVRKGIKMSNGLGEGVVKLWV